MVAALLVLLAALTTRLMVLPLTVIMALLVVYHVAATHKMVCRHTSP
jgi:hypothetical protein